MTPVMTRRNSARVAFSLLLVIAALMMLSACSSIQRDPPIEVWWDMKRQGKFKPQLETDIFPDHRQSRLAPEEPSPVDVFPKRLL